MNYPDGDFGVSRNLICQGIVGQDPTDGSPVNLKLSCPRFDLFSPSEDGTSGPALVDMHQGSVVGVKCLSSEEGNLILDSSSSGSLIELKKSLLLPGYYAYPEGAQEGQIHYHSVDKTLSVFDGTSWRVIKYQS